MENPSFIKDSELNQNNNRAEADLNLSQISQIVRNEINLNSYASRKSLAQGMLDIALLAANATQLKYVLSVGREHEFYLVLLILVVTSIVLQAFHVLFCIILGLKLNINNQNEQNNADILNNSSIGIIALIVIVNIIISAFDIKSIDNIQTS